MKFVAVIEARMSSTRMPGKTLADIAGKPLLQRVIDRFILCKSVDDIIVAMTTNPADNDIEKYCKKHDIKFFKGSENDVMQRVIEAAEFAKADVIVEQGADNPFIDPIVVDKLIEIYKTGKYDFVSSALKLAYPLGIYAHVFSLKSLKEISKKTKDPKDREHVNNYYWEHPEKFRLFNLEAPPQLRRPELRLTVDYPEDIDLARKVFSNIKEGFSTEDVINFLDGHPEIANINKHCVQRAAPHVGIN